MNVPMKVCMKGTCGGHGYYKLYLATAILMMKQCHRLLVEGVLLVEVPWCIAQENPTPNKYMTRTQWRNLINR